MSYEPTTWKDGDLVTSAKLNKMEQGIAAGGGILIVHVDENNIMDKTWQEIHDADVCYVIRRDDESSMRDLVIETYIDEGEYGVEVYKFNMISQTFSASSSNDYPARYTTPNIDPGNTPATE